MAFISFSFHKVHIHDEHRRLAGLETSGLCYGPVNIADFLRRECFPRMRLTSIAPNTMKRFKTWLQAVKPSTTPSTGFSEREMYEPLVASLNNISRTIIPGRPLPVAFHICAEKRPEEVKGGIRGAPDLVVFPHGTSDDYWARGLGFVEVKTEENEDPFYGQAEYAGEPPSMTEAQTETWKQLSEYATIAFRTIPRCFLLAIGIFGGKARLFRWDRSSVIVSDSFDYKEEPAHLAYFLTGLARFGNSGIDTTAHMPVTSEVEKKLLKAQFEQAKALGIFDEYEAARRGADLISESTRIQGRRRRGQRGGEIYITLGRPLFSSRSIKGRGTRVWVATKLERLDRAGHSSGRLFIIKDSWREKDRWTEGRIYDAIQGDEELPIFGVARFEDEFDVGDQDPVGVHCTAGERINAQKGKSVHAERIHHRCILESVGIPITRFKSTKVLMMAVRDAVKGHQNMCLKDVLHRDISVNNIMISVSVIAEGGAMGFLIDPELAAVGSMPDIDKELRFLTGTLPFTSLDRLRNKAGKHAARHDLESFFWVVLFVVLRHTDCCYYTEDGDTVHGSELLPTLYDHIENIYAVRKDFLESILKTLEIIGNAALTDCLRRFGDLVLSHYRPDRSRYAEHELDLLTHDRVVSTIQEALDSEGWPDEATDGPRVFKMLDRTSVKQNKAIALSLHQSRAEGPDESKQAPKPGPLQKRRVEELDDDDSEEDVARPSKQIRIRKAGPLAAASQKRKQLPVEAEEEDEPQASVSKKPRVRPPKKAAPRPAKAPKPPGPKNAASQQSRGRKAVATASRVRETTSRIGSHKTRSGRMY